MSQTNMSKEPKETYLGLVGQLQREESDIGWADLFLIPDRLKYIDYTAPYIVEYASFMLGQHHSVTYVNNENQPPGTSTMTRSSTCY